MELDPATADWVHAALASAQRELAAVENEITRLTMRRETLAETVSSLTMLVQLDHMQTSPSTNGEDQEETDEYRRNMARHMRNQLLHINQPAVTPPKRRQDYESSTIRVLRVFDGVEGHPPLSAGDVVGLYLDTWEDGEESVLTQAIRRNVGYGFLVEARTTNRAKVYSITPAGLDAIQSAREWKELKEDKHRSDADADEAAVLTEYDDFGGDAQHED